jgi:3D (Asp-Asp-Asp) domain-containing protein
MKLFLRGGMSLAAMLFAAFLIFYARPLSAETTPSQGPAQQETQTPAQAAQQKKEAEAKTSVQAETAELSETASGATKAAVKDADATAATTVTVANSTEAKPTAAPLTAPQAYTAFSYSLCCRGSSGMGVRRGTIAADPRILPYGTRVRMTGAGSYDGEYLVTDAGTAIKGNKIDVWVPTIHEARRFGRKNVKLTVLSYGGRKAKAKR